VDLDLRADATRRLIAGWFEGLAAHGVRMVRLDAVGYVVKRAGTSCFMVEPEIWEVLGWLRTVAAGMGMLVLPEVHDVYATHARLSAHGYWTYDFVLPGLVLLAFDTGDARRLAEHLARSPERQVTTLDCHDGIPVHPDLEGILSPAEMARLAERVIARGGNVNRLLSATRTDGLDVHQLNCTYYSALGEDDERYLAARAIQLFARGIPQVYYVGLLAGTNDQGAVERTGEGRAINRHDYPEAEVSSALERPVVRRLLDLLRLRASHPAFGGELTVETPTPTSLRLSRSAGQHRCVLTVDLASGVFDVT
jgi:sucrose phosphorylase